MFYIDDGSSLRRIAGPCQYTDLLHNLLHVPVRSRNFNPKTRRAEVFLRDFGLKTPAAQERLCKRSNERLGEDSNVDFTREFVNVLVSKRVFKTNLPVIKTRNEMLSEPITTPA